MYRRYVGTFNTKTSKDQGTKEEKEMQEVKEFWDRVRKEIYHRENTSRVNVNKGKQWKRVTVFISSTFTDFFNEREILVKQVFPELKEWCQPYGIELIECDLRWGIPKYTTSVETIITCLEELENCAAETGGSPFFINLSGERYGWVPEEKDITQELKERFCWINGASITFMEIFEATLRNSNPNAAIFFRDPKVIQNIPDDHIKRFVDEEKLAKLHLMHMKKFLWETMPPEQVYEYSCKVEGVMEDQGRQRVKFSEMDDFADKVTTFLKKNLKNTFSDLFEKTLESKSDEENIENMNQQIFLESQSAKMEKDELLDMMLSYATGNITIPLTNPERESEEKYVFTRDPSFWKIKDQDNPIVFLTGKRGMGKTTLMSKVAMEALEKNISLFYHFVGCSLASSSTPFLIKRLVKAITGKDFDINADKSQTIENARSLLLEEFDKIREDRREMLIIIDGIDELDEQNDANKLSWLPPMFPGNIRCIISSAEEDARTMIRILEHPVYRLEMKPLGKEVALEMIRKKLLVYKKVLSADLQEIILSKSCINNPLWVTLFSEELRMFGDFRLLEKKIDTLTDSPETLITEIFNRLIAEDHFHLMKTVIALICLSRSGIPLNDFVKILGDLDNKIPIPTLVWSRLHRNLKPFIRYWDKHYLVYFRHNLITETIRKVLLGNAEERRKYEGMIAKFLLNWCDDTMLRINDLPHHLNNAGMTSEFVNFMRTDKDAGKITLWQRSNMLRSLRCHNLADSVITGSVPVQTCMSCAMQKCKLMNSFHRNKAACACCGNNIIGPINIKARLCVRHAHGQSKFMVKCFFCEKRSNLSPDGQLLDKTWTALGLCTYCGFGNSAKMCCNVQM